MATPPVVAVLGASTVKVASHDPRSLPSGFVPSAGQFMNKNPITRNTDTIRPPSKGQPLGGPMAMHYPCTEDCVWQQVAEPANP